MHFVTQHVALPCTGPKGYQPLGQVLVEWHSKDVAWLTTPHLGNADLAKKARDQWRKYCAALAHIMERCNALNLSMPAAAKKADEEFVAMQNDLKVRPHNSMPACANVQIQ